MKMLEYTKFHNSFPMTYNIIKGTFMRTYEKTHPWINFRINLGSPSQLLWLGLGEAASKIDHLGKTPLQPETSKTLLNVYLAKGVAATTAIEGNTLSEAEVLEAVEGKLKVPPSREYLKQEVDNIIAALNDILRQIAEDKLPPITADLICGYDKKVLEGLPLEPGVIPGEYRPFSVVVGDVYRGAPAEDCSFLMSRLCEWLNGPDFEAPKGLEVVYAIIKSIIAHLYIAWIHPFGDGNGRTARLLEFYILISAGVPQPAAHLLSNHYNQTRAEYYRQLNHASKSGGDLLPFIEYAVRGLVDGLRSQLEIIWNQNWYVAWKNHIHGIFQNQHTEMGRRRCHLALDLGLNGAWVETSMINQLTTKLTLAYAKKTPKTLTRDVNALLKLDLIERSHGKIRARREIIFGLLPFRKIPKPSPTILSAPTSAQNESGLGQQLLKLLNSSPAS